MKHPLLVAFVAFFVVFSSDAPGQEENEVSFQLFYDSLSPYGDWVEVEDYGYCWQPRVKSNWRPYTDGRWAYTDAGWTWVSNEDFGWATYHYGRWTKIRNRGWVWVPGYEWAPAWVSWRSNDEYIGWAPLPPEAVWNANQGFNVSVDTTYDIGPEYYNFCPISAFGTVGLAPIIVNPANNVTIVYNTINITYINIYQRGIFCGGPNWNYVNQHCRRPIPQYRLDRRRHDDWGSLRNRGGGRAIVENGALVVPAPRIGRSMPQGRPQNVAYRASRNDINRGWDDVRDSRARDQIRERNQQQARNPQNQPRPAIADRPPQPTRQTPQERENVPSRNLGGRQNESQPPQTSGTNSGTIGNRPNTPRTENTQPSTQTNRPPRNSWNNDREDQARQNRERQEDAMRQQANEQAQRRQAQQQQQQGDAQQRLDQQRREMQQRSAEQQRQQQQQLQQQQQNRASQNQNLQRQQQQMEEQRQRTQQQRQQSQQQQQNQQRQQSQQQQQNQQRQQSQQQQQNQQRQQSQQQQQGQQRQQSQQQPQGQQRQQSQQQPQGQQRQQVQQQGGGGGGNQSGMGQGRRQSGQNN